MTQLFRPINGWTKAEILKTIQDLFTAKSVSKVDGACMYRGENGSKCAVGLFIPDQVYRPEMDSPGTYNNGTDVESLLEAFPEVSQFMPLELEALKLIQAKHDGKPSQYETESRSDSEIKAQLIQWVEENVSQGDV